MTTPPTSEDEPIPRDQLTLDGTEDDGPATIVRLPLLPSPAEMQVLAAQRRHVEEQLQDATVRAVASVAACASAMKLSAEQLDQAVRHARQLGASWPEIGRAVGISRQAAAERWGS